MLVPGALALVSLIAFVSPFLQDDPDDGKSADGDVLPTLVEKTGGLVRDDGLLTTYRDDDAARLWLRVPPPDAEGRCAVLLYVESIATGVGSNPLGLDRGALGASRVVVLRRIGRRVLLEEVNLRFRADGDDPAEHRAVRESFATSILWGAEVAALDPDGTSLVDLSSFIMRDAHGVARRLQAAGEGSWSLDADRSTIDPAGCLVFPDNVELEAILTFKGDEPGRHVRSVTPHANAITVVQHHSLIRLPDDGYHPRRFDPRCGSNSIDYLDYAATLDEPVERKWITRHRLEKTNPAASSSPVVEPIVYYVDRGAPEPIRSALVEGASWWAEAFAAAGFENAYRVEVMPEGAHPLDVRYNVIQWVHRSTRGWSYGGSIEDPRTGEILKGHVSLGSLRVRQDILLFEGLIDAEKTGTGAPDDPVQLALARIRQLSAHEVGHTLGFQHNFAASTWGGRASVMDYPAPLIDVTPAGALDFSRAYGVGVGVWDVHTVQYAYTQFAPGTDEPAALASILADAERDGMLFLSDADARPAGAAQPLANLWDNGADPIDGLEHALRVRGIALDRFGLRNLAPDRSLGRLEEVFVPLYLHHRYQLDAAVKAVGGRLYRYGVRGGPPMPVEMVDAEIQQRALAAVLACLDPARLDIPEHLLTRIAPPAPGDRVTGERFRGRTDPVLDPVAIAVTAATPAIDGLLNRARCARLIDQHRRDPEQPGLDEVLDALLGRTVLAASSPGRLAPIQQAISYAVVERLARLSMDPATSPLVRERAEAALHDAGVELMWRAIDTPGAAGLRRAIERALDRRTAGEWSATTPEPMPPGSPIGSGGDRYGCSVR